MTATAGAGLSGINLSEIRLSVDDTDASRTTDRDPSRAPPAAPGVRSTTTPRQPFRASTALSDRALHQQAHALRAPCACANQSGSFSPGRRTPKHAVHLGFAHGPATHLGIVSHRRTRSTPSTSALTAPLGVGGASGVQGDAGKKRKKVALAPDVALSIGQDSRTAPTSEEASPRCSE